MRYEFHTSVGLAQVHPSNGNEISIWYIVHNFGIFFISLPMLIYVAIVIGIHTLVVL